MSKLVKDISTKDVVIVTPETTVSKAISMMETNRFHNLLVEKEGVIYLVNIHDLLLSNSVGQPIGDLMYKPHGVLEDATVIDACFDIVNSGQRVAPVYNSKNNIAGIITDYDIIEAVSTSDILKDVSVDAIMTKNPITIDKNENVGKARNLMSKYGIGRLIVLDEDGEPEGIVTEDDIIKKIYKPKVKMTIGDIKGEKISRMSQSVSSIMSYPVVSAELTDSIPEVARILKENDIRGMPVYKNGTLRGVITRYDILKYIYDLKAESMIEVEIRGELEEEQRELAERILSSEVNKIVKYSRQLQWMKISIKKERDKGGSPFYNVKVYVKTPRKLFVGESKPKLSSTKRYEFDGEDIELIAEKQRWDFIEVLKDALESVKKQIEMNRQRGRSKNLNQNKKEILAELEELEDNIIK
ncbi:CBS domain-containing protein [Methanococcus voltae]|uniref:CBS domain-containing protein n=1 Tax=Methanococcus voltae TaxID=2188 RepID=UPI001AE21F2F|nr:CBS domain-containing protein [Methanococcus voltae]MBP2142884.1 CBS domain-containing protein [Methanococcus voltae]